MSAPVVLAVDGGNFKTDLALVRADGEALALVRGPQSSPHHLGVEGCVRVLEDLLAAAVREAGLPNGRGPDGRQIRFPALGAITGDWGGGYDVGLAGVSSAARSEDGRGPRTSLEWAVPA